MTDVKQTGTDLRRLVDNTRSHIGSLKQTGSYTLETFLTSLVYNHLPFKLRTSWDLHTNKSKTIAPVEELLDYLCEHAYSLSDNQPTLHKAEPTEKKPARAVEKRTNNYKRSNVHVVTPSPTYKWDCALCKTEKHPIFLCPKWQAYTVPQRLTHIQQKNLCHNCLAVGHAAESCKSHYKCRECQQSHHTTIHQSSSVATPINSVVSSQVPDALMMTAQVLLTGPRGVKTQARALIDPGAGISLVSSKIAQALNLPLTKTNLQFSGVQGTPCKSAKHITQLSLSSLQGSQAVTVRAAVVSTVTNNIPTQEIAPVDDLPHLTGLGLADPSFHIPGRIDILLGADVYPQIMVKEPMVTGAVADPAAQQTIFGWAIVGPVRSKGSYVHPVPTHAALVQAPSVDLDIMLSRFWVVENHEEAIQPLSVVEEQVQAQYTDTVRYCPSTCRYQVALPWKEDVPPLGDSRAQALSMYITNERSILIYKPFQEVVQSYLDLGHAELIPSAEPMPKKKYYLPMHCVAKQSSTSTKLRVVFDGSAVSTSGISLNQSLMVGPTLHPSLESILLKFRSYPVAVTADIAKMYREVELAAPDRDVHRFLWRSSLQQDIQDYRMTRVTFGVSASPYLAVRTLQQTAADHRSEHPEAVHHIMSSFYVDDLLAGATTVTEAKQLYTSLREVLQQGGFNLCKWRSSSPSLLESIPTELQEKLPIKEVTSNLYPTQPKALGLEWDSSLDCMSPCIKPPGTYSHTKRGIVSDVSKTFDVLGWIAPSILVMKILYQKLWLLKTGWDEEVPPELLNLHAKWREQLPLLSQKQLPRCYVRTDSIPLTKQLHGFADASAKAHGAVVYLRSTYSSHPPLMSLVLSKTRVAKLTPATTIPRQELCGAVLLSQLLCTVKDALQIPDKDIHAWTDSSIVLSWLDGQPRDFKVYVSNRVSTILQVTSPQTWRHVPTADNPADCASRGLMLRDLLIHSLWWDGPSWLLEDPITVPRQPPRRPCSTPEQRVVHCNAMQITPPLMLETRYSSYHKLLSITAWCLRFYHRLKQGRPPDPPGKHLTSSELGQAEHLLVRLSQARSFPRERQALLKGQVISQSSKLISLSPFIDQEQLLRVGGRLSNSALTLSQQHPLIVNSKDTLIHLLFTHMHECLGHCGPSLLLAATGWRYHVVGARRLSRSVCSQCKVCRKAAPRPQPQLLGQLPKERVTTTPAFHTTGLDFSGPFTLKRGHTRKPVYVKAYICIFVCFSTRAVHIEVISDLTTSAFLAGMLRFVSRRNRPHTIYSDNGSNFVGAKNQLRDLYKFLKSCETDSAVHQHLLRHQVTWNNIPERAPHFGGLWESAVKSMKYHLKRVVGSQVLTYEELHTVTCQVEACLNSRPILTKTRMASPPSQQATSSQCNLQLHTLPILISQKNPVFLESGKCVSQ